MKRSIALVLAATLCVSPVALTACAGLPLGGGISSVQLAPESAEKFVGTWKPVYGEFDGVYYAGPLTDISEDAGIYEYKLNADGTGSVVVEGEAHDLTWELTDSDHALTTGKGLVDQALRYDEEHDALYMDATEDDPDVVALTRDGKVDGSYGLKLSDAVPVKSLKEVVGDWTIYGISANDMTVYGEPDKLEDIIGKASDYALTIKADGSTSLMGNAKWKAKEQGGTVKILNGDKESQLKKLDDLLLLEMKDEDSSKVLIYKK